MTRSRRGFIGGLGVALLAGAGCLGDDGDARDEADVVAGPNARLEFDPEELTVAVGETVTWYFDSNGHNVSCVPGDSDTVALPDDADPFSSYPEGDAHRTISRGETFSYTLETLGSYTYVCTPHDPTMQGTLHVEE